MLLTAQTSRLKTATTSFCSAGILDPTKYWVSSSLSLSFSSRTKCSMQSSSFSFTSAQSFYLQKNLSASQSCHWDAHFYLISIDPVFVAPQVNRLFMVLKWLYLFVLATFHTWPVFRQSPSASVSEKISQIPGDCHSNRFSFQRRSFKRQEFWSLPLAARPSPDTEQN